MKTTEKTKPRAAFQPAESDGGDHEATNRFWRYLLMPISLAGMLSISSAPNSIPPVIYKLPDQIPWSPVDAAGAKRRCCWRS